MNLYKLNKLDDTICSMSFYILKHRNSIGWIFR